MNILSVYSKKYLACTRGDLVGMGDERVQNARHAERVGEGKKRDTYLTLRVNCSHFALPHHKSAVECAG